MPIGVVGADMGNVKTVRKRPRLTLIGTFALAVITSACASTGAVPRPFPVPGSPNAPAPAGARRAPDSEDAPASRTVPRRHVDSPRRARARGSRVLHNDRARRVSCSDCDWWRRVRARAKFNRRRTRRASQRKLLGAAVHRHPPDELRNVEFRIRNLEFPTSLRSAELTLADQPARRLLQEVTDVQMLVCIARRMLRWAERFDRHTLLVGLARKLLRQPLDVALWK